MKKKNKHIGSKFDDFLKKEGLIKEVTFKEYNKRMDEILDKPSSVADKLIEMVEYSGSVKIKNNKCIKKFKKKVNSSNEEC